MILPPKFDDYESYFQAAVEFLNEFQWLYNFPNTELLVHDVLSKIPDDWAKSLLCLTNEEFNQFPNGLIKDDWPPSLVEFSRRCLSLYVPVAEIPLADLDVPQLCQKLKRGLTPKKQHEVRRMAAFIHKECQAQGITRVLDVGSGLGYMGQLLHHCYGYKILGLESNYKLVNKSYLNQMNLCPSSNSVKSISFKVTNDSASSIQTALEEYLASTDTDCRCGSVKCNTDIYNCQQRVHELDDFSSLDETNTCDYKDDCDKEVVLDLKDISDDISDPVCMIGLHACGDLAVDSTQIFRRLPSIRTMILVPCCYHKMTMLPKEADIMDDSETFYNFPLSRALKQVVNETLPHPSTFLRRPFLRLASQISSAQWSNGSKEHHEMHSVHLMGRAMLELFAQQEGLYLKKKKRRGFLGTQFSTFESYLDAALPRFEFIYTNTSANQNTLEFNTKVRSQVAALWATHASSRQLAEVLSGFHAMFQSISEQLVIYDRARYLEENCDTALLYDVALIKVMDEVISPRCIALVSRKSRILPSEDMMMAGVKVWIYYPY